MTGTPWWATILVGIGAAISSIVGTTYATRKTIRQTSTTTRLEAEAARREEWFRRVQWATGLAFADNESSQVAGFLALRLLANSSLANADDLELLSALSEIDPLTETIGTYGDNMDETGFVEG